MDKVNGLIPLKSKIPFLQDAAEFEQIHKGYSSDAKYIVRKGSETYLLRTFDSRQGSAKKQEFDALLKMQQYEVRCSRPLEFGVLSDDGFGYMVLSYIEGNDASEELPGLTADEQVTIGLEAGRELLKMHRYKASGELTSWYDRKMAKHKRYADEYASSGIRFKQDGKILSFIEDHIVWIRERPNVFQHDDFHVGNLIVRDRRLSGVIDFNRYDWGDPVHDFLKVGMFSAKVSVPFCVGQIRGYHDGKEPEEPFWQLYSLYLAMCLVSSVVWIGKVKPEETDQMLETIERVVEDHDGFERLTPKWYSAQ